MLKKKKLQAALHLALGARTQGLQNGRRIDSEIQEFPEDVLHLLNNFA